MNVGSHFCYYSAFVFEFLHILPTDVYQESETVV
jgi:hypothetical protein